MRSLVIALLLLPRISVADVSAPADLSSPSPIDPLSLCFELKTRPFAAEEARALQQKIDALPISSEKAKLLGEQALMMTEVALGDARHLPSAIEMTRSFSERYPKDENASQALFSLGILEMRAKMPAEAREAFKRLLKTYAMSRYYPDVFVIFGDFYFEDGEFLEALKLYERVYAQWPRGRCAAYAKYRAGFTDLQVGDPKQALLLEYQLLTDGNRSGPFGAAIRRTLVEAYVRAGDPQKARPFFQRAGDEADVNAMLRDLALRYRRKNDEASAMVIEKDLGVPR
jgi:tetratricopeptide (TPR) repeat protein